jgi:LmbE family N-acetylglucosaminyl deacetylase
MTSWKEPSAAGKIVLVVSAHPDDVDFGAAGTIAKWTKQGARASYCIVTDGDAGSLDPDMTPDELVPIRRDEQIAAAANVGVTEVRFLGYKDGTLSPSLELRRDLAKVIREIRPNWLICHSPERHWSHIGISHPDHRAVGEACLDAVYPDARNPYAFPELLEQGLTPHVVEEVFTFGSPDPNVFIDVTDTFAQKMAALFSHVSQVGEAAGLEERMRNQMESSAQQAGLPSGSLAEAFRWLRTA